MAAGILGAADRWRDDFETSNRAPHNTSAAVCLMDKKSRCFLCLAAQTLSKCFGPDLRFAHCVFRLTHTLTHTRKNCVETVGEIPLDTISKGIKNVQIVPDSTLQTYLSVLVRMRSPVRIWIAAPQNPRKTAVCGGFALSEKASKIVSDPHRDPHAEISGNGWRLLGRKFQPFCPFLTHIHLTCCMKLPIFSAACSCFWRVAWV